MIRARITSTDLRCFLTHPPVSCCREPCPRSKSPTLLASHVRLSFYTEKWSVKSGQFFSRIQVYCYAGLCRFGERFSLVEYVVGRSVIKSLMGAFLVEVAQVGRQCAFRPQPRLVCMPVDLLLLEAVS